MITAAILAGGSGTRMNISNMPKQFLNLGARPIILHTLEKFLTVSEIDTVYIGVHPDWLDYLQDIIHGELPHMAHRIEVVAGGKDRNGTILNIIEAMEAKRTVEEDDILITHDAVRPFVSRKMILDNIEYARKYDAVDTVVPAVDTIVESVDGTVITSIPDRSKLFQGQTPQTFHVKDFLTLYERLSASDRQIMTDACKIFSVNGKKVGLVNGAYSNFKITTVTDLKVARAMLEESDD